MAKSLICVLIILIVQFIYADGESSQTDHQHTGTPHSIPVPPDEQVSDKVARHILLGDQLVGQRRYDEAIQEYKNALKKSKKPLFAAHINMGYAFRQKKEYDAAVESYKQAIAIRPQDYRGYFGLADASYSKGDYPTAEEGYRKAIEVSPGKINPAAHHFLGLALFAQKRTEEAIRQYRLALAEAKSKYAEARYNLGIALIEVGKPENAEHEFRAAIQQEGKNWPEAHFNLAIVLERQAKFLEAANEYETYLQQAPNAEDAIRIRARIEELKGKKP